MKTKKCKHKYIKSPVYRSSDAYCCEKCLKFTVFKIKTWEEVFREQFGKFPIEIKFATDLNTDRSYEIFNVKGLTSVSIKRISDNELYQNYNLTGQKLVVLE